MPERTIEELESSRPLGWRVDIGARHTRLTELARVEQFPGVLHQMALRMRSATPTAKSLPGVQKLARAQLAEKYGCRSAAAARRRTPPAPMRVRSGNPSGLSTQYYC